MRGIHRSPVNSPPTKASDTEFWYFIWSTWINGWVNDGDAGDLRRHSSLYDVTVMEGSVIREAKASLLVPWYAICFVNTRNTYCPMKYCLGYSRQENKNDSREWCRKWCHQHRHEQLCADDDIKIMVIECMTMIWFYEFTKAIVLLLLPCIESNGAKKETKYSPAYYPWHYNDVMINTMAS